MQRDQRQTAARLTCKSRALSGVLRLRSGWKNFTALPANIACFSFSRHAGELFFYQFQ